MKPTKSRNQQIYKATNQVRSKQLTTNLSKQLRKKFGRRNARILSGDTVKIIRGEYKGIDGKVKKILTEKNSIAVEGVQKEKLKGGKIDISIHSSNVVITSVKTDDKWRVKILEGKPKAKAEPKAKSNTKKNKKTEVE